jgi:hypothetical protein
MSEETKEFIPISNDQFIHIKATPRNIMPLMNKMIVERTDQMNARHQHAQNPPKFKTEEEYYRCQVQPRTRLANGAIVMGNTTEEEKKTLNSKSDGTLRRLMIVRQKALDIMRKARMENKTQGNYYRDFRGGGNE